MKPNKTILLVLLSLILLALPSQAAQYNITGYINRSDSMTALNGVTVSNGTNTTTTNATGYYIMANMSNNTGGRGWELTVTAPNDGYYSALTYASVNGADNTSAHANLTLVTPSISGVTEASKTISGITISFTPNISTVGNRIKYGKDSALSDGVYTGWSNSTTSPSFVITNLGTFTKYYYQSEAYNNNNATYSTTSSIATFTTKAGVADGNPYDPGAVIINNPNITTTQPPVPIVGTSNNGNLIIIVLAVIVIGGLLMYSGKKGRR